MKVDGHSRLKKVISADNVDALLVRNQQGTPVLIVMQFDDNTVIIDRAGEPDFENKLKMYGIDKGPLVQNFN